jgi:hypothetical protein
MLGVSVIVIYNVLVIALLLFSGLEMFFLLTRRRMGLSPSGRGLVLLCWIALFFVFDIRGDAGQREHLFILFYIPYLFLRILRHRGGSVIGWFALLLGIQAGIGASLKPHFLLAAVCVELALLLATKRWRMLLRIENFALAAVVAAYVVHWFFVPAAMREAFFFRWLPLVAQGYGVYNMSYHNIVYRMSVSPIAPAAVAAAAAAAVLTACRQVRLREPLIALAVLAGGGLFILFVQHKGFPYHRIPVESAGVLCLAMLAVAGKKRRAGGEKAVCSAQTKRPTVCFLNCAFLLLVAIGLLMTTWFADRLCAHVGRPEFDALRQIISERSRPGEPVLIVATSVRPAFPMLLQLGRPAGSRYVCALQLAMLYAGAPRSGRGQAIYRRPDEALPEERQFLVELGEDVARLKPRLLIINNTPGWRALPSDFNIYEYLVYTGWTAEALKPYREVPGPQGWKVFEQ